MKLEDLSKKENDFPNERILAAPELQLDPKIYFSFLHQQVFLWPLRASTHHRIVIQTQSVPLSSKCVSWETGSEAAGTARRSSAYPGSLEDMGL